MRIRVTAGWEVTRFAYVLALAIGAVEAALMFPWALVRGGAPAPGVVATDFLQHATGQIGFFRAPWHWPLLVVPGLDAPVGTNITFTDSIPLEAVALKLARSVAALLSGRGASGAGFVQGVSLWQAACWVAQPVAAVFALRSCGEWRIWPAAAIAVLSLSMPTFLLRMWHTALDSHFLILLAIGLYARALRTDATARRAQAAFAGLAIATLVIHPYLMVMVGALLAAVPLTLALRGGVGAVRALLACAAAAAGIVGLGALLGDWTSASGASGFGVLSMNLASPFWPGRSGLFPMVRESTADGTGNQYYEGYQYLGAGLILLLAAGLATPQGRGTARALVARHAGLAIVLAGLTAFALSTTVYLFHVRLLHLSLPVPGASALRSSGRLFWPVAYVLLVGAVRLGARLGRAAPALLAIACVLQWQDASALWRMDRDAQLAAAGPPEAGMPRLEAILSRYESLAVHPRLECRPELQSVDMPPIWLAARRGMPIDTMYVARADPRADCASPPYRRFGFAALARGPLDPGALQIATGETRLMAARAMRAAGLVCGVLGPRVLCSASGAGLEGLAAPAIVPVATDMVLPTRQGGAGAPLLLGGWSGPEIWGTWSDGSAVSILVPAPAEATSGAPSGAPSLALEMRAAPFRDRRGVEVTARVGGVVVARWTVGPAATRERLTLPPLAPGRDAWLVELAIARTLHVPDDPRALGVGLLSLEIGTGR